jgi:hypothetical protein
MHEGRLNLPADRETNRCKPHLAKGLNMIVALAVIFVAGSLILVVAGFVTAAAES